MNTKYYADIKNFPSQFAVGFDLAKDLKVAGEFERVILCGMGGSSSFISLLNDYFACDPAIKLSIEVVKGYKLPLNANSKALYLIVSFSGNTEETLSCLDEVDAKGFSYIIITSGGQLEDRARIKNIPLLKIPNLTQPRLSTGYFIGGILQILTNCGLIPDKKTEVLKAAAKIDTTLDETRTKDMAQAMQNRVPLIYATDNNSSLAHLAKIKFNENSKTQSFWNFFPELNHNEMVGFTKLVMNPYFIIFKSQFTHQRNYKRIEIFTKLMKDQGSPVEVVELKGDNVLEEILMGYYFVDHITYYLADAYGIDPEPVAMVEEFKKML